MGKMTRDEFIKSLVKLYPDVNYENVLKFVQRQTKHRTETDKEVITASRGFDVVWHVYHGVGTERPTKVFSQIIRNKYHILFYWSSSQMGSYFYPFTGHVIYFV